MTKSDRYSIKKNAKTGLTMVIILGLSLGITADFFFLNWNSLSVSTPTSMHAQYILLYDQSNSWMHEPMVFESTTSNLYLASFTPV